MMGGFLEWVGKFEWPKMEQVLGTSIGLSAAMPRRIWLLQNPESVLNSVAFEIESEAKAASLLLSALT